MDEGRVPWSLTGFLLVNLTEAMCLAAVMNPNLNLEQRLENALTGFVLLDLCELVAEQRSKDHGVSKDRFWIARQTQRNLQELCACCAIQVTSVNGPYAPWSSTELKLEQYFGHLRGQFANSQFRTRDYLHASAKKSYQTLLKMQHQSPTLQENLPKRVEKPLSDETFIACSERALNSALRLMAACSEFLGLGLTIGPIGMF